ETVTRPEQTTIDVVGAHVGDEAGHVRCVEPLGVADPQLALDLDAAPKSGLRVVAVGQPEVAVAGHLEPVLALETAEEVPRPPPQLDVERLAVLGLDDPDREARGPGSNVPRLEHDDVGHAAQAELDRAGQSGGPATDDAHLGALRHRDLRWQTPPRLG